MDNAYPAELLAEVKVVLLMFGISLASGKEVFLKSILTVSSTAVFLHVLLSASAS